MNFTKEKFDKEFKSDFYFLDAPFRNQTEDEMFKLFNLLPDNLQGLAVSWGCTDSVFRDDFFEFIIENQFGLSTNEYYESEIFNEFHKKKIYQSINWEKLENAE
jgi:hypothetical protein